MFSDYKKAVREKIKKCLYTHGHVIDMPIQFRKKIYFFQNVLVLHQRNHVSLHPRELRKKKRVEYNDANHFVYICVI